MSTPKNYIPTGISKHLLTPCRRVGLSRSKKTPKNINENRLTPSQNIVSNTTPKTVNISSKTPKVNASFDETPIKPPSSNMVKEAKNSNEDKVTLGNLEAEINAQIIDIKDNRSIALPSRNMRSKYGKKNTLNESESSKNKIIVAAEVHHPIAKRSINFDTEKSTVKLMSQHIEHTLDATRVIKRNRSTSNKKGKNIDEDPLKEMENKKAKLELHANKFSDIEGLPEQKQPPKPSILTLTNNITIKDTRTDLSDGGNGSTLGRFNTDDYLKEYCHNPEMFQKMLETGEPTITTFTKGNKENVESDSFTKDTVTMTSSLIGLRKMEKTKRSLSTKKSSLQLKVQSEAPLPINKPNIISEMTVVLEHLTKEDLQVAEKCDETTHLESSPPSIGLMCPKIPELELKVCEDDDELFTSSPESEKRQRENLLQLTADIEKEIRQKQEKLEKLKQAQVYKKKHSPEKLKVSSDRWIEACRAALNDLLTKMLEHGSIDMDTLIKNLNVPNDIVQKLKL